MSLVEECREMWDWYAGPETERLSLTMKRDIEKNLVTVTLKTADESLEPVPATFSLGSRQQALPLGSGGDHPFGTIREDGQVVVYQDDDVVATVDRAEADRVVSAIETLAAIESGKPFVRATLDAIAEIAAREEQMGGVK